MIKSASVAFHGHKTVHGCWNNDKWLQQVNRLHHYITGTYELPCDGKNITVKAGCYYLFPSNLEYYPKYDKEEYIDHQYIDFFVFPAITSREIIEINPAEHPLLVHALEVCFGLSEHVFQEKEIALKNAYGDMLNSAVAHAVNIIRMEFPISFSTNPRVNRSIEYIHTHYDKDLNLDILSEQAYCAKNYFVRLFKDEIGCTPYQYIKNYRFMVARDFLRKGYTVKEAALAVGYGNTFSFSSAYYKAFKEYPSDYRERFEKGEKS